MRKVKSYRTVMGLGFMLVAGLAASAGASIITVTGGNVGQGVTLDPARVVEAFDIGSATTYTVQGIPFTKETLTGDANITLVGNDYGGTVTNLPQPDSGTPGTNDYNLSHIYGSLQYQTNTQTIVLNNLTPGAGYFIQSLVSYKANAPTARIEDISLNGVPIGTVNAAADFYNVVGSATADALGHISISFVKDPSSTDVNPIVNAVIVSTPEPASLGLLALGGVTLLRRRKH